jgi:DNA modification methylase
MSIEALDERALQIEMRDLQTLLPYAQNARVHSDEQVEQIAASIREFGWTNPVLIDGNGGILAGHGRVMAARLMGISAVPCIRLSHLTEAQRRAYVLVDNQLGLTSEWDENLLRSELVALDDIGFDLPVLGFSDDDLETFLQGEARVMGGNTHPDHMPSLTTTNIVTRPGDIWLLGRHRFICGDSTSRENIERLFAGDKPRLMVTDPPYGVEYDPDWRNEVARANGEAYGGRAIGETLNDDRADWREAWALFPGDVAYVWHAGRYASTVQTSLEACDFEVRAQIIWAKPRFAISRGHYHWQHEPCWYAVRKGCHSNWRGDRSQTTLWTIGQEKDTNHSAQKPLECMLRPILNHSNVGDAVYEPFSGSGTTLIAAEQSERRCYASELNPAYVDLAVRRWQEFTGEHAIRQADRRLFDELDGS